MRYYFAGAYGRRAELEKLAGLLSISVAGAEVVSRWLFDPQDGADAGFCVEMLHLDSVAKKAWEYGWRDIEDLASADAIVSFTGQGTRGGRHIEHGIAIGSHDNSWDLARRITPIRMIIVGLREHVFHCHPATEVYPDFDAFLKHESSRA